MISVAEADRILATVPFLKTTEAVPIERAVGRVLAGPVTADRDGPPYDRVAMDGYAVHGDHRVTSWTVVGLQSAGKPPVQRTGSATAIEVATGAVLPLGCDLVIPYELTSRDGNRITLTGPLPLDHTHVHQRGTDYHRSEVLLSVGTRLNSPHLHCLASVGLDPVTVVRQPVWALAATGDELVEIGAQPQDWQIRRSNAAAIAAEARAWGLPIRDQVVLPDQVRELRRGVEAVLPGLDVLVLTGGVSAGVLDLVPEVLSQLGAKTLFHKVAQRPGKPLWCGLISNAGRQQSLIFGLPGNPVSSLFAFRRYVLPWLLAAEGRPLTERRVAATGLEPPPPNKTVFLPWSEEGLLPWKGSGDFLTLAASSGFIEIDQDPRSLSQPRFHSWGGAQ